MQRGDVGSETYSADPPPRKLLQSDPSSYTFLVPPPPLLFLLPNNFSSHVSNFQMVFPPPPTNAIDWLSAEGIGFKVREGKSTRVTPRPRTH